MKHALMLGLLFLTTPAFGQELRVVSSFPADGDSSVAVQTVVRFTFSAPLDTSARFSSDLPLGLLTVSPHDSIRIDSVYFSGDLTQILLDVTHTDGTDFVWIVTGAWDQAGNLLGPPYALNYTTAAARGPYSVSGSVWWAALTKSGTGSDLPFVVALMDEAPQLGGEIVAAAVSTNEYTLGGVRVGSYWPVALYDYNRDGVIEPDWERSPHPESEALFWDDNEDRLPDAIIIKDSSRTNIDFVLVIGNTDSGTALPGYVTFMPNHPNPFRAQTMLSFRLERPVHLRLAVHDLLGRQVATLAEGLYLPGVHELTWDARGLPGGLYVARLHSEAFVLTRMMTLVP